MTVEFLGISRGLCFYKNGKLAKTGAVGTGKIS
jgi:hypothetical protein